MSRVGKKPITIPEGVEIKIEKSKVSVKGKLGMLEQTVDGKAVGGIQFFDISLLSLIIIFSIIESGNRYMNLDGRLRALIELAAYTGRDVPADFIRR